jgi:hypothetical protein
MDDMVNLLRMIGTVLQRWSPIAGCAALMEVILSSIDFWRNDQKLQSFIPENEIV